MLILVDPEDRIETRGSVRAAVERFLTEIMADPFIPKNIGIELTKEAAVDLLRELYL